MLNLIKVRINNLLDDYISSLTPQFGGSMSSVFLCNMQNLGNVIVKYYPLHADIAKNEVRMLNWLQSQYQKSNLFPEVLAHDDDLIVLSYIEHKHNNSHKNFEQLALSLHEIHKLKHDSFGFSFDTALGKLTQPNNFNDNWIDFFANNRLMFIAKKCLHAKAIDDVLYKKVEKLVEKLPSILPKNVKPSLVHGDFWHGNFLFANDNRYRFIDPAIYFAHNEMDLAYAQLFGSVDDDFLAAYYSISPLEDGFDSRKDIYNLWPLLCHVFWFGGSYVYDVKTIVNNFV